MKVKNRTRRAKERQGEKVVKPHGDLTVYMGEKVVKAHGDLNSAKVKK